MRFFQKKTSNRDVMLIEFTIPNENNNITEKEFNSILVEALIDGLDYKDAYTAGIILEYLQDGPDIMENHPDTEWVNKVRVRYNKREITRAVLEWIDEEVEIKYTKLNIYFNIEEAQIPEGIARMIIKLNGTQSVN